MRSPGCEENLTTESTEDTKDTENIQRIHYEEKLDLELVIIPLCRSVSSVVNRFRIPSCLRALVVNRFRTTINAPLPRHPAPRALHPRPHRRFRGTVWRVRLLRPSS